MYNKLGKYIFHVMLTFSSLSIFGCKQEIDNKEAVKTEWVQDMKDTKKCNLEVEVMGEHSVRISIIDSVTYEEFINCIDEFSVYSILYLELKGTNTCIYLDEILINDNFEFLIIENGGIVTAKNIELLQISSLKSISLEYVSQIENEVISNFTNLDDIEIRINNQYVGNLPIEEMLNNNTCKNVIILWDDDMAEEKLRNQQEEYLRNQIEWDYFENILSEQKYLKRLYKLNSEINSYISYEFYEQNTKGKISEILISIKDKESNGKKYFDILTCPVESIAKVYGLSGQRIRLEDINFDGHKDLIFLGYNNRIELYQQCVGFLWNENENIYELNETVPKYFDRIDTDRNRLLLTVSPSAFEDNYYIYEYNGETYIEKKLEVRFIDESNGIVWKYLEKGELIKTLYLTFSENDKASYVFENEDGSVVHGEISKSDMSYYDLGKRYFPEFDFYFVG